MLGKFSRAFRLKLVVFVQGKLRSILNCSFVLFMIVFFLGLSCRKLTARFALFDLCILCHFIQVLQSGVSSAIGSCLLTQGNITRLALCLVLIALKLARFRKPTFFGLKSGAGRTTYNLTISRVSHKFSQVLISSHTPVFIGLNYRCGLHIKLKEVLYSQNYRVLHYCCLLLTANMGTTIEQYRSRIGCHNNFVKAKDAFSRVRGRFWNMMLMMFYLNVFYLPTLKDVVGHYKLWNEVMFWFTQMMCYNVYIPLLIRQANDVEENPGPTIFDIIDPTTTVSADSSQGNEALFGENAGKQCVAMSLTAIIYHQIQDISLWTNSTLNNILVIGNNLYSTIRCSVRTNDYLLLTDVPDMVSIFDKVYSLQYSESFTGSLFMTSNIGPYMSLRNSLLEVFSNSQRNYNCCLLTIGINTVAVFKNSEQSFQIFDSHSRDLYGMPDSFGRCTLIHSHTVHTDSLTSTIKTLLAIQQVLPSTTPCLTHHLQVSLNSPLLLLHVHVSTPIVNLYYFDL